MRILSILFILLFISCSNSDDEKSKSSEKELFALQSGSTVTFINAINENGEKEKIDFTGGKHLIFVFKEDCKICKENVEHWNKISERLQENYKILGLSVTNDINLSEFKKQFNCEFELFKPEENNFTDKHHIYEYPFTVYIKRGMVYQGWGGILTPKRIEHILNKLK